MLATYFPTVIGSCVGSDYLVAAEIQMTESVT
jgi:hypothetical protein